MDLSSINTTANQMPGKRSQCSGDMSRDSSSGSHNNELELPYTQPINATRYRPIAPAPPRKIVSYAFLDPIDQQVDWLRKKEREERARSLANHSRRPSKVIPQKPTAHVQSISNISVLPPAKVVPWEGTVARRVVQQDFSASEVLRLRLLKEKDNSEIKAKSASLQCPPALPSKACPVPDNRLAESSASLVAKRIIAATKYVDPHHYLTRKVTRGPNLRVQKVPIEIYTDGSFKFGAVGPNGGQSRNVGGFGLFYGPNDYRNRSGIFYTFSNESASLRAEIEAIHEALNDAIVFGFEYGVVIHSDCAEAMRRIHMYKESHFRQTRKAADNDIISVIWRKINFLIKNRNCNVILNKVKGHSGNVGNEGAHSLAHGAVSRTWAKWATVL